MLLQHVELRMVSNTMYKIQVYTEKGLQFIYLSGQCMLSEFLICGVDYESCPETSMTKAGQMHRR